jgi:type IV pilus assembly protein PilY1
MNVQPSKNHALPLRRCTRVAAATALMATLLAAAPARADLAIGNNPLYLVLGKANVLVTLDNSNSMDEDATGAAVGSNSPLSKSEIARGVVRTLTQSYRDRINLGLMSYRQNAPGASFLHNAPYDASYNPATFNPAWTGDRASPTNKRSRIPNPTSAGNFIHYNVALPFYAPSNQGNAFCYSPTSVPFNNGENPVTGPWDTYRCFSTKTGTSDTLPTPTGNAAAEAAQGYAGLFYNGQFFPTDSDFAQGILDFGKQLSWNFVGRTWLRNDSPGRGFLNVPIRPLDATQANTITTQLACNIPGDPAPCTSSGIRNAGLTPIEGTLLTARDYFGGSWNNAGEGFVAGCYPLPNSCGKNFVILLTDGLPSTDRNGALVAVPATGLAAAAAAAAQLLAANVETYVIGFALPYGTNPASLNAIAAAGGTTAAYNANDTATLEAAFRSIFDDIFRKTSAFGSVSQNSTAINDGSRIYQSRFDSTDWSGEIEALKPLSDGTFQSIWSTNDAGRFASPATRKVFTLKPGTGGVAFKVLGDLTSAQQDGLRTQPCGGALVDANACGQARIDWLRGDRTNEQTTGPLRKRSRVLGDIISSSPYYVRDSKTLFAGANDGMLHAFDAVTGNELFAYVPNALMGNLFRLTDPNYLHEYFVDGEIAVSEKSQTPGNKNILVATLGRGGRAVFALDVTAPATFGAANVMWEYTEADLGVSLGKPLIAKLNNGKTAVLIGNGYNSGSERAVLFIIDIETGALIKKIDTMAGSASASNGMASPRGWDNDANGTLDIVYVGDRLGNLWKFDLSSALPASWVPAFGTVAAPEPLFVARDASNNRQPITGGVSMGINARKGDPHFGKLFVTFGTGQYLLSTDVPDKSVQSWYGLIDSGSKVADRSVLKARTIVAASTMSGNPVRAFSAAAPGDMIGMRGWHIDLIPTSAVPAGERMIGEPKMLGNVVFATSIIPSADPCTPGGEGFLNAVDAFSGASLTSPFFDANNDGSFNSLDTLTVGTTSIAVGSINLGNGLTGDAIAIGNLGITIGTNGEAKAAKIDTGIRTGRIAWREIVRQN